MDDEPGELRGQAGVVWKRWTRGQGLAMRKACTVDHDAGALTLHRQLDGAQGTGKYGRGQRVCRERAHLGGG